jgi:hypothetical protein
MSISQKLATTSIVYFDKTRENMKFKKSFTAVLAILALGAGAANANTFALGSLPTAQMTNPGSFSSTFYSSVADASASLNFVLNGYRTLDGSSSTAHWDDLFTLSLNNAVIGSGYFRLGGGGSSSWTGTGTWTCTTCSIAQTNTGGSATFSGVTLGLLAGANTLRFAYSAPEAPGGEGFANEAWGIGSASVYSRTAVVSAVPEPETYAMLLAGLGLMGTIARRRNKINAV